MTPKIQSIVSQFVSALTQAIQEEGAAAFRAAISGGHEVGNGLRAGGGAGTAGNGRQATTKRTGLILPPRPRGQKRDPKEIEAQTKTLLAAIKKTPGQRIEQISKVIGISTKDLALPVAKLFEAKAIKTTGQRRATKYFAK